MKAIKMPCPKCGEQEARIAVHLWAPGDPNDAEFHCHDCDADISIAEVREWIARWQKLLVSLDVFFASM